MRRRLLALALLFLGAFALLLGRLACIQIVDGERYAERAGEGRRRVEFLGAPRGRILDRSGRVLAADFPTYRLVAILADLDPGTVVPARVARILRRPRGEIEERWRAAEAAAEASPPGGPGIAIARAPSPASLRAFRALARRFEGLLVEGERLRASPALLRQRDLALERTARLTGLDPALVRSRVAAAARRALSTGNGVERAARLSEPVVLTTAVPFEIVADLEEDAALYPGVRVEVVPERRNPEGPLAGHVLGYVRAPEPRPVEAFGAEGAVEVRAGVSGVEAACDSILAGTPGARLVEWNRRTREFEVLAEEPPVPGADVRLTIDAGLERAVEAALDEVVERYALSPDLDDEAGGRAPGAPGARRDEGKRRAGGGAAVLLDARTGEVLALASAPRYDPSRLRRDFPELEGRLPSPLLHRAIAAQIPPGSIVKTLTAAAALESGAITPETEVSCEGRLNAGRAFRCNGVHGDIRLQAALARSCNVFFYKAGERLGEAPLAAWLRAFGFGEPSGIEIPGEQAGLVPSGAFKRARHADQVERVRRGEENLARAAADLAAALLLPAPGGPVAAAAAAVEAAERDERLAKARAYLARTAADLAWTAGDDRNTAIGQGNLLATPLQAARLAAAIASGGTLFRPRVLAGPAAPGRPVEGRMPVSRATWEAIRAGMVDCVSAPKGTAHASGLARFRAAAKTGTAEAPGGSHAWIIGFAPAERPEVAFALVVEHVSDGVHGGDVAGPAAARMLEAYFGRETQETGNGEGEGREP